MARQYAVSHGLPAIVTRNFNVIGPGQSASFAFSSFAFQIARAERGEQPAVLETGNLEVARDFLDVQDLLPAWDLVMARGRPGEAYNVGSGTQYQLRAVVKMLLEQAKVSMTVKTAVHRTRARTTDPPALRADTHKLQALGSVAAAQTLGADIGGHPPLLADTLKKAPVQWPLYRKSADSSKENSQHVFESGNDYRHHRSRRQRPGGTAARQGLYRGRHGTPHQPSET